MRKLYYTLSVFSLSGILFSQKEFGSVNGIKVESYSNITKLPLIVSVNASKNLSIGKFPDWLKNDFCRDTNCSFSFTKNEKDPLGMIHSRFVQDYKGVKIENSMVIAHCSNNSVTSFNGDWFTNISISNSHSITEQQALQFALNKIKATKYKWENKAEEAHMKEVLNDPAFTYTPKGELVIFPVINTKQKTLSFLYAYKFNIYAEKPLYRAKVYVDATTGNIIKEQNLICTVNATGTAATKYSGSQTITMDNVTSNSYRLRETGRGNGIETYNLNNSMSYANTDFTNTSTNWTSTGYNQVATDAHWGAEKTYDYYNTSFNRNSLDNNGYKLLSYVHYDVNYVNAFWDGQRMTYGDGNLSMGYKEMTGLDVCGHEITHGVVQFTAQLSGGESDALNEGFADIFGTSVEWFARPAQCNWIMGNEITTSNIGLRDLSNPSSLNQPNTYLGNLWDPNNEPHQNNGPCIYWFYLLSAGGSGTNDNNQSYAVSGITMAKASAIAYRALSVYMTPSTDYTNVRYCAIQAAKDLYGSCSNEVIQTTNAWYAVGVGSQYTPGAIAPDFSADQVTSCTVPSTINFTNQTNNGSFFTWYFGDGTTSTANNPVHTYGTSGIYSVKLVANGCSSGKDSILKTSYININTSNPCVYSMPNSAVSYSSCTGILYDDGGPAANYNDNTTKQVTIIAATGNVISLTFNSFDMEPGYDYVYIYKGTTTNGSLIGTYSGTNLPNTGQAIMTNTNVVTIVQSSDPYLNYSGFEMHWNCTTSAIGVGIATVNNPDEISVYPNPVNNMITLNNINGVKLIEITNALGQTEQSVTVSDLSTATLLTGDLATGMYIIKLYTDEAVITKKIIKQ